MIHNDLYLYIIFVKALENFYLEPHKAQVLYD